MHGNLPAGGRVTTDEEFLQMRDEVETKSYSDEVENLIRELGIVTLCEDIAETWPEGVAEGVAEHYENRRLELTALLRHRSQVYGLRMQCEKSRQALK